MLEMLLQFIIIFLIVWVTYYVFVLRKISKKKVKKKENIVTEVLGEPKEPMELVYLKNLYHFDLRRINKKKVMYIASLLNSFIIALTSCVVILVDEFILQLIISFFMLAGLIILSYHILGTYLKKKEG